MDFNIKLVLKDTHKNKIGCDDYEFDEIMIIFQNK